jgi:hypothetical protein
MRLLHWIQCIRQQLTAQASNIHVLKENTGVAFTAPSGLLQADFGGSFAL